MLSNADVLSCEENVLWRAKNVLLWGNPICAHSGCYPPFNYDHIRGLLDVDIDPFSLFFKKGHITVRVFRLNDFTRIASPRFFNIFHEFSGHVFFGI